MLTLKLRTRLLLLILFSLALGACAGAQVGASSWPGLAADDSQAYIAFNQSVIAVDLESGQAVWGYTSEDSAATFFAPPAVDQDTLYAGDYAGDVYAFEKATGVIRWQVHLSDAKIVGGPAVTDDLLLVPSSDRRLYALDKSDGSVRWSYTTERPLWATPLIDDGQVILPALDHHLYAIDLESGELAWEVELDGALADRPAQLGDLLLVGTFTHQLVAIERSTGHVAWQIETNDWVWGNPSVTQERAFFGDVNGTLRALDGGGAELWRREVIGSVAATPAVNGDTTFFATEDGSVMGLSVEDGDQVWQQNLEGRLLSDPILVDNTLLIASLDGESLLTAFNAESGAIFWRFSPAEG